MRLATFWFLAALCTAGAQQRPPIVGVAHISLKSNDMAAARQFYGHVLGFAEPFSLGTLTYFKVNDRQYIEVSPDLQSDTEDRLANIGFETTSVQQLRDYLAAKGIRVPDKIKPGRDGNLTLTVKDPDDHSVEFVEYVPGSLHSKKFGQFLPETRVSERIIHVGITVADKGAADRFYRDILGFREFWHGGMQDDRTDWVDMRVPEGTDWVEYMMNVRNPTPRVLGIMHHLALGVPDIQAGYRTVTDRGFKAEKPKVGRDGKWQLNLYDPNGTRAELMEPKPVEKPCCSPMLP